MPYLCVQTYKRGISIQLALCCDHKCRSHRLRFTAEDIWAIMLLMCALEPQVHCCDDIGVSKMCFEMGCSSFFSVCFVMENITSCVDHCQSHLSSGLALPCCAVIGWYLLDLHRALDWRFVKLIWKDRNAQLFWSFRRAS